MIVVTELVQTCPASPSQWEGRTAQGQRVYIRYRWGCGRLDIDGQTVYRWDTGDGLDGLLETEALRRHLAGVAVLPAVVEDNYHGTLVE